MDSHINIETLEYLANLARIELDPKEEERLLRDLRKILDHVSELQQVNTKGVKPVNGGTDLTNIFREDTERENTNRDEGVDQFPETENGFLKIPPVFKS